MGLLDGKVAAITGAGGGIGRAHALLFAREGAAVVVNDLGGARDGSGGDRSAAQKVVDEITAAGGRAIAHTEDISKRPGAESLIAAAIASYGKLDVMVNNAGILRDKTLRKMTDEMWHAVVEVHLTGTYLCTQAAAAHLMDRNEGGSIINTSSVSGLLGNFGQANYAAAKAGIYGLTRTAALELKKYRVRVNALAPVAHTRMTEDLPMMQAMANAKEILGPELVAPAALFLASDLASDITGQVLAVEGNRLYLFKMIQTPACLPLKEGGWTAQEIRDRWAEISGASSK
jgi:NAD(P)-dependent dehydrogenase (short-subunit alcohol dehydrogenase family)